MSGGKDTAPEGRAPAAAPTPAPAFTTPGRSTTLAGLLVAVATPPEVRVGQGGAPPAATASGPLAATPAGPPAATPSGPPAATPSAPPAATPSASAPPAVAKPVASPPAEAAASTSPPPEAAAPGAARPVPPGPHPATPPHTAEATPPKPAPVPPAAPARAAAISPLAAEAAPSKPAPASPAARARPAGTPPPAAPAVIRNAPAPRPATPALTAVEGSGGLVATGLGKRYKKRPVVRQVSLHLKRGEAVGLLGPNGAGKTTTFYMITGLVRPDEGSVTMDGADVTHMPMYRRARLGLGYLPQEASIFRGLSVEDNIRAALEVVEPKRDRREQMLDSLLAEFGIAHLRRAPSLALSGGERRRCEIARALATHPAYILLDEPLAGIDPIAVGEIRDLVKHLKNRGIGVLITDHNVRETLEIIDRAYIMHDGQVLMEGRPQEIVAHEGVRRVYLGEKFSL